jgi:hypothetical protein
VATYLICRLPDPTRRLTSLIQRPLPSLSSHHQTLILTIATPPFPASSLLGLLPNPPPLAADLGTALGTAVIDPAAAAATPGDVAAVLAAAKAANICEREHKAALVWQQEKASVDALERDLATTDTFKVSKPPTHSRSGPYI